MQILLNLIVSYPSNNYVHNLFYNHNMTSEYVCLNVYHLWFHQIKITTENMKSTQLLFAIKHWYTLTKLSSNYTTVYLNNLGGITGRESWWGSWAVHCKRLTLVGKEIAETSQAKPRDVGHNELLDRLTTHADKCTYASQCVGVSESVQNKIH